MAKVHEKDHNDEEPSETPESDLDNQYTKDSYPLQSSDIEEFLESHSNYSENIMFIYHISKHSASSYESLEDRGQMVA